MLTRKDLVKRWGVSERTVDRWVKCKNVPYVKISVNGYIRFREEEIKAWETKMLMVGNDDL